MAAPDIVIPASRDPALQPIPPCWPPLNSLCDEAVAALVRVHPISRCGLFRPDG